MAKRGTKLGDTYLDMHANREGLDRGLEEAKRKVEKDTREMGDTAEKNLGGGFKRVGDRIEKSTEGIRKFTGAISSTVGSATALLGAITGISLVVTLLVTNFGRIRDSVKEAFANQKQLNEQIEYTQFLIDKNNQNSELYQATQTDNLDILRRQRDILADQIELTDTQIEKERRRAQFARDEQEEEAALRRIEVLEQRRLNLITKYAAFRERVGELEAQEVQNKKEELRLEEQKTDEAGKQTEETRKQIQNVDELMFKNERMLADLRARRRRDAEEEEAEARARAERMADSMAKAFERALSGSSFNQNIAGPIEEMTRRLEAKLDSMKFGRRF